MPPGNRRAASSSKFSAAAANVSSKVSRICRSVSRISPSNSRRAVSRSFRWRSSSSTCASACAYSSWASGLTGPSCSRRRASRSRRPTSSARSCSGSGSAEGTGSSCSSAASVVQRLLGVGRLVARTLGSNLRHGQLLARRVQPILNARLLLCAGAQLRRRPSPPPRGRRPERPRTPPCARRWPRGSPPGLRRLRRSPARAPRPGRCRPAGVRSAPRARRDRARRARREPARPAAPRRAEPGGRRLGPSSGADRRRSIAADEPARLLGGLVALDRRRPMRRDRGLAGAVEPARLGDRGLDRARWPIARTGPPPRWRRSARRGGCARRAPAPRRLRPPGAARSPRARTPVPTG